MALSHASPLPGRQRRHRHRRMPSPAAVQVGLCVRGAVRAWHWINALAIVVLAVTGYFIGSPLPSMPGEASAPTT